MTTYYKAVRPDGTDFHTGTVRWLPPVGDPMPGVGMVVTHPTSRKRADGGADGYLSVATVATECTGMRWPCRLAVVEPTRAAVWTPDPDKLPSRRASWQWRVVDEIDAHHVLGPQGEHVAALIERASRLTDDEVRRLSAAWAAVRGTALVGASVSAWAAVRGTAWVGASAAARAAASAAARADAREASRGTARAAASAAARTLAVRDLIDTEHYGALTLPWRQTVGRIHPDDPEVTR